MPHTTACALGINVNERGEQLDRDLLKRTHTLWARSFLDVLPFYCGERSLEDDAWIKAFEAAAAHGYSMILSLKWAFQRDNIPIPMPESAEERNYFVFVDKILDRLLPSSKLFVINNEPFLEISADDQTYQEAWQGIPLVIFHRRLNEHVQDYMQAHPDLAVPVYIGSFTRLFTPQLHHDPATQELLQYADADPGIAGVDVHVHGNSVEDIDASLAYVRRYTNKPILITEFSVVWKYKAHLIDQIGCEAAGQEFAAAYQYDPQMTVYEYLDLARQHPVPKVEWDAFLAAQPWFDPNYLQDAYERFQRYGVSVATYSFVILPPRHKPVTPNTLPWFLNPIFSPYTVATRPDGTLEKNYGTFEAFVDIQHNGDKALRKNIESG